MGVEIMGVETMGGYNVTLRSDTIAKILYSKDCRSKSSHASLWFRKHNSLGRAIVKKNSMPFKSACRIHSFSDNIPMLATSSTRTWESGQYLTTDFVLIRVL